MDTPYFSQRRRGFPGQTSHELTPQFWTALRALIRRLDAEGYWGGRFGSPCADNWENHTQFRDDTITNEEFLIELGYEGFPLPPELPDADYVFDVMEFLARAASKPTDDGDYHSFFAHTHVGAGDGPAGVAEVERQFNRLFQNFGMAYEIGGGLVRRLNSEILDAALNHAPEIIHEDNVLLQLIHEAIDDFFYRDGSRKQRAVEKMFDAFERLKTVRSTDKRTGAKELHEAASDMELVRQALDEDMRRLTDIGNSFGIRHFEVTQARVADPVLLDYLFYQTYNLVRMYLLKLRELTP